MKSLLVLALCLIPLSVTAETVITKIHSYNAADGFLRLDNGRVAFLNHSFKSNGDFIAGATVKLELDDNSKLQSIEYINSSLEEISLKGLHFMEERPEYTPTILPNFAAADEMFNRLSADYKRVSECSDRAHVWAYDEFKANGIKSQKVFAFFTASYINRNGFKWWFHVAPLVQVQEGAVVEPRVLDFMYTDGPKKIKEWTDMMVFSKRPCKMTTKFSEYDVNPQTEDCYMMIDTMYNRLPADLHAQELKNIYRKSFNEAEVRFARKLGFEAPSRTPRRN